MNKREMMLNLVHGASAPAYVPAAFFMHFDPVYQQGQAAIDKHLAFFRYTGMDFVKIQYEQGQPAMAPIRKPHEWANAPLVSEDFFAPTLAVVEGLVKAAKADALVIMTLYSPFMWLRHLSDDAVLAAHLVEAPEAVQKGLEIVTENVLTLARGCKQAGIDGFYASSQGGEASRFAGADTFRQVIKPSDLAVWDEIQDCAMNVLHICDFVAGYDDLTPFLDYPGHIVNCSLKLGEKTLTPAAVSEMFARPFMGGMERKGVIADGSPDAIHVAAREVLASAPPRFILAADCTVPSSTPWENLKAAVDAAHSGRA